MGLGKTVQAISALKHRFEQKRFKSTNCCTEFFTNKLEERICIWFSGTKISILDGDKENKLFYLKTVNQSLSQPMNKLEHCLL